MSDTLGDKSSMRQPGLLSLPVDALNTIIGNLSLQSAIQAACSCKTLRDCYNLSWSQLATTLSFAHTGIADDQLLAICRRAKRSKATVRVLSVAGCSRLTIDGLVAALIIIGRQLYYLDLSACHAGLVSNSSLERISPFLPSLRVLRLAYVPQVTGLGLAKMVDRGFGRNLETLDVSYTWTISRTLLDVYPNLRYLIAPGTKLLSMGRWGQRGRGVVSGLDVARSVKTLVISMDMWDLIASNDVELLRFLFRAIELEGLEEYDIKRVFITSTLWNQQVRRASESTWMRTRSWGRNSNGNIGEGTSLLSYAALNSAVECAEVLVDECGSQLSSQSLESWNPLKYAILTKTDSRTKRRLIKAILDSKTFEIEGSSHFRKILSLAAKSNDLVALRALLGDRVRSESGPSVVSPRGISPSPSLCTSISSSKDDAAEKNAVAVLSNILLEIFTEIVQEGRDGSDAGYRGVIELLVEAGAYVSTKYKTRSKRENALHLAARCGDPQAVELLLKGASVKQKMSVLLDRSSAGQTSLMVAASSERSQSHVIVNALLTIMAEIEMANELTRNMFDFEGARAIVAALMNGGPNDAAARVIAYRRPACMRCLVDKRDSNWATVVLQCTARRVGRGGMADDLLIVGRRLLEEAANAAFAQSCGRGRDKILSTWLNETTKDTLGRTALHYAAGASDPQFARMLLQYGARPDAEDDDGATPLCTAVEWHASRSCLELLICAGASVNKVDARLRTPLHRAAEARNGSAAAVLLRHGADPYCEDRLGLAPVHIDRGLLHRAERFFPYPISRKLILHRPRHEAEDIEDSSFCFSSDLDSEWIRI